MSKGSWVSVKLGSQRNARRQIEETRSAEPSSSQVPVQHKPAARWLSAQLYSISIDDTSGPVLRWGNAQRDSKGCRVSKHARQVLQFRPEAPLPIVIGATLQPVQHKERTRFIEAQIAVKMHEDALELL